MVAPALALILCQAAPAGGVVKVTRYVNYFDPEGKREAVIPKDLPLPPRPSLPAGPATLSPGYPNDPQRVHYYHMYQEPDGRRILQIAFLGAYEVDTLPGFMDWKIWYRVSNDGGKTVSELRPVIQVGEEHDLLHPLWPTYIGKNGYCPSTAPPIRAGNGEIMAPFYFPPLDEQGEYYNPAGAYTYSDGGVLIGWWNEDGTDVTWELGDTVRLQAHQSTRGNDEPAVIELDTPGRFLMVIRASNDKRTDTVSGYKWMSISQDYCRTWSAPQPFTYSSGESFFSPAACSELVRSAVNGKLYWIGNLCGTPPKGNSPRYPLVIGQVDEATCGLIKDSVLVIDDLNPELDSPQMQLSNFSTVQNPDTGQIIVRLTRIDPGRGTYGKVKYPPCAYVIDVE